MPWIFALTSYPPDPVLAKHPQKPTLTLRARPPRAAAQIEHVPQRSNSGAPSVPFDLSAKLGFGCEAAIGRIGNERLQFVTVLDERRTIQDRARRTDDRHSMPSPNVARLNRRATDHDARAVESPDRWNGHPRASRRGVVRKLPDRSCASMAQNGVSSAGKKRRLWIGMFGRHGADEVDATVERDEAAVR